MRFNKDKIITHFFSHLILIFFFLFHSWMKREEMRWVKRKMRFNWAVHSLIHSFPFISFNKIKFISWNSAKEFIHQRDFRLFSIFSHCFIFQQCSNILIVSNYCYNTSHDSIQFSNKNKCLYFDLKNEWIWDLICTFSFQSQFSSQFKENVFSLIEENENEMLSFFNLTTSSNHKNKFKNSFYVIRKLFN